MTLTSKERFRVVKTCIPKLFLADIEGKLKRVELIASLLGSVTKAEKSS